MPLYEYRCVNCDHQFEALARTGAPAVSCPACGQSELERLLSNFAVSSEGTRHSNLMSARQAGKKEAVDKAVADREAVEHHRH